MNFATDFVIDVSFTVFVASFLTASSKVYLSSYFFKYELASQTKSGSNPAGSLE